MARPRAVETARQLRVRSGIVMARFALEPVACAGCAKEGEWLIDSVAAWCPDCGGSVRPLRDKEVLP